MRAGRKSSHWIWYVFPQIAGLGRSSTAQEYALHDLAESVAYLRDPVLAGRYDEITRAVEEQLARGVALTELMGGSTDALKLVSSLTLFRAAAERWNADELPNFGASLKSRIDAILERAKAQGFPPCAFTISSLGAGPDSALAG